MSIVRDIERIVGEKIAPLLAMVEYVTDIVMADDGTATCRGAKVDDDDGHDLRPNVAWQLGFYARPLDGASGVVIKAGGRGGMSFLVGWRNSQYEVTLDKGEVAMANEAGAVVKLDKDGNIIITPKAGQTIQIAGTSFSLLKTENFLDALKAALGTIPTAGATNWPGLTDSGTLMTTLTSAITAGTYKSTVAKNG